MEITKEKIEDAIQKALEEKGKRKFVQTMEMVINFKSIDFSKQDNRLNLSVVLPNGLGKNKEVIIFSDAQEYSKYGRLISSKDIEKLKTQRGELKKLVKGVLLTDQKLLPIIIKNLGQFLGPRGKIPKVITKNIEAEVKEAKSTVKVQTKGKFLPTVHVPIGSETMSKDELVENALKVLDEVTSKVSKSNIKSIYFKLTMGKPVKLGAQN